MMGVFAQSDSKGEGYKFTTVKEVKYTPVKNQNRSSTCWSFSGVGFLECELLRKGKGEFDLSDMWVVAHTYNDKADVYVRMHGNYNFGPGGAFFDVLNVFSKYGMVPEEAYPGNADGSELPVHGEIDEVLTAFVDAIIKNKNKKLSPVWKDAYSAIVQTYLGKFPENFTYNGVNYTPQSFAKSLDLNMDDYISLTSFSHHPFYSQFAIEIPDNWAMEQSYNLPLDEFMQVMNNAVDQGFSIAWGSDVSDKGFNWRKGVAVVPDKDFISDDGSDRARWESLSQNDKEKELYSFDKPGKEKVITQEIRQEGFDNFSTTDDHGMVIVGKATDQNGTPYFIVKNSWGTFSSNPYNGLFYASESFIKMQTINIVVHKDAIPKAIKSKLGIK
ncbi:aminopeptidase [Bacteroidales bacterium OttesenSCG-928-B11]|nr:aminopeptidase [Bacteroidales bacterium OttesenSCG-928-E04]MDL2308763.1 aminopeptidase [Bacteroidales bacterium OttesenSCG-928-C03]MDL2312160.1 aminopeptidase [Bacteroidales bacterium OttesenSCG-928-B11]MDL2326867.1 aminopeptidase [Bacteroidales bacterium OttesenSCG-928-A14]